MGEHVHKRWSTDEVKVLLKHYTEGRVPLGYVGEILGLKRSRCFALVRAFREDPDGFSVDYHRSSPARKTAPEIDAALLKELAEEKKLIEDPHVPVTHYNYSYLKDRLLEEYGYRVSLPTIISRAKTHGYYQEQRRRRRLVHDRQVLTHAAGQLLQHDSSHHHFSPLVKKTWYLITTVDDYSRLLVYAVLVEKETSWAHIKALEAVLTRWGCPYCYYVDSHSIFRFVQGRDSRWRQHRLGTDEVRTQWQRVCDECRIKVHFAGSPQAKGKIERPYRWLQDRLVRACARQKVTTIDAAQDLVDQEVRRYNEQQVHRSTGDIPLVRFQRALQEQRSLFREFTVPAPYTSLQDIFCLRLTRTVDAYHRISVDRLTFKVHTAPLRRQVELRISPAETPRMVQVRIWYQDTLTDVYQVNVADLRTVHF
jgi:hypothetical protein